MGGPIFLLVKHLPTEVLFYDCVGSLYLTGYLWVKGSRQVTLALEEGA